LAKEQGVNVAENKHHGHGDKLDMPDERKDSVQYIIAGADASLGSGGGFTQHILQHELTYQQLHALATLEKPDVILVEGYKEEVGEKVILVRKREDWEMLQSLEGITLVVGLDDKLTAYEQIEHREAKAALDQWFTNWSQD